MGLFSPAFAPHLEQNGILAAIVLFVGAWVLRRLQPVDASRTSRSWVPLTLFFGPPIYGVAVILWMGLAVGEDSKSLDDALDNLPAVLLLGLIVGTFASLIVNTAQRGWTYGKTPDCPKTAVESKAETPDS